MHSLHREINKPNLQIFKFFISIAKDIYFDFTGCCGRPTVSTTRRPRSNSYSALDSTSDDGGTLEECKTLSNKKPVN